MTVITHQQTDRTNSCPGPAELVQMARLARRHYVEGQSKSAIAEELGLSRFQVARSLQKARESGLVRITIDVPGDHSLDVEERP